MAPHRLGPPDGAMGRKDFVPLTSVYGTAREAFFVKHHVLSACASFCVSWANGPTPKRVSDRSSGIIPVSASKNERLRAKRALEPLLPIFRTATMGVANECRLPQKVSRAGGDDERECKASGVARAILRSGTTRGSGGREALEDA
jgi:hypothetical protein